MKELLFNLLQAVLVAVVPVITAFLCAVLKKKAEEFATKVKNEQAKKYITEASAAVSTAVAYTSQTYVDTLKKSGTFTEENQKEALQKAKDKAMEIVSKEAKDYIAMVYGDFQNYITSKIEEEVRNQKSGILSIGEISQ